MGRYAEALGDFDRAIQLSPKNPANYSNRAKANFELGKFAETVSDLDLAIQLNPESPSYYSNRAKANINLGKFQEAQNDYAMALHLYDEVLRQDASNSRVLFYRGAILHSLNRKSEALESFRRSCDAGSQAGCRQLPQD